MISYQNISVHVLCLLVLRLWSWTIMAVGEGHNDECELQTYGPECEFQCHCEDYKPCARHTGRCYLGCRSPWHGPTCNMTRCSLHTFGPNCESACFCKGEHQCDQATGRCPFGCIDGVKGRACNVSTGDCEARRWGPNCTHHCHCGGNGECSVTTGRCLQATVECLGGWVGLGCRKTICPLGRFGLNCSLFCRCEGSFHCSLLEGKCQEDVCQKGWIGQTCNRTNCTEGLYGTDCNLNCKCEAGVPCNQYSGQCLNSDSLSPKEHHKNGKNGVISEVPDSTDSDRPGLAVRVYFWSALFATGQCILLVIYNVL